MRALAIEDELKGRLFGEELKGCIHSVFSKAVNLTAGCYLFTIVQPAVEKIPDSIALVGCQDFRSIFARGALFRMQKGRLDISEALSLELKEAEVFFVKPVFITASADRRQDAALRAQRLVQIYARRSPLYDGYFNTGKINYAAGVFHSMILKTASCLERGETEAALLEAVKTVGLGIGLTPSGDDFFAGLLLALYSILPEGQKMIRNWAHKACERTGGVSVRMIENAARGRARSSELEYLSALEQDDWESQKRALHRILQFGATSGSDTALGLLTGLRYTARQQRRK